MTPAARERWRIQAPVLAVCAFAWILILVAPSGEGMHHAHGLAMVHGASAMFGNWILMMVAMMSPLLIAPIQHVHDRSFSRRRKPAVLLFLVGYGVVWMVVGFGLTGITRVVEVRPSGWAVVVAGFIAVVWQVCPLKQRCLNRCHGHRELAAFGLAADVDALRFGLQHGVWCVGSCWALMLLPMMLMRAHVAAMAAVGLWLFAERIERPTAARWEWRGPRKAGRIVVGQAKILASMNALRNLPLGS
jgi:predicted metal-binding membrane protein